MIRFLQCGFVIASLTFAGCSEPTTPVEPAAAEAATTSTTTDAAPRGIIPQSQLDALTKAAGISNLLEQSEQERRKKMEAQGL